MQEEMSINDKTNGFLSFIANSFNSDQALQEELKGTQGWINARIGLRSEDGKVNQAVIVESGSVRVERGLPDDLNITIVFRTENDVMEQLTASRDEAYRMILRGRIRVDGNMAYMGVWDYLLNLIIGEGQIQSIKDQIEAHKQENIKLAEGIDPAVREARQKRAPERLSGKRIDPGVKYLNDPYLPEYRLHDFPRLERFLYERIHARPEVSAEYGKLATDFYLKNGGYENNLKGEPWEPNERHASCFRYILENRKPVIREGDLLAGSYSPNPVLGAVGQPITYGPLLWGELRTCSERELEPYDISEETIQTLHKHVFPFWADRYLPELWKKEFSNPLAAQIHDRYFSIFYWETVSNMESSPGFERILKKGIKGLREQIDRELSEDKNADQEKIDTLNAMKVCFEGIAAYTKKLSEHAKNLAENEKDASRREELLRMHRALEKVPEHPAETLYEAVQAMMLMHIVIGMETLDDGPSFGRLDQIFQPFFISDISKLKTGEERDEYIKSAIEIVGCFFMKVASHWPQTPDIGTWLNSGSPLNATIVVGGVTREGADAVNDMSYIILKVTEILGLNDPNIHARYKSDKNSREFLKRVCEVNYITGATPGIHNDDAVLQALTANPGWKLEDMREWTTTGCVEPSIPGKHNASTSSLEISLVAPFEMALNNGTHPIMEWDLGPETGSIENDDFKTFDDFFEAFKLQCDFMFGQSVIGNNQIGEIYQRHLPQPLFSALLDGCIESGRGMNRGGAMYNSSGVSVTGLTDVVDSLMAIKKMVFDEKRVSFKELKKAIDSNYENDKKIHALIKKRVPRFGSGDLEAVEMAKRVTRMVNDFYRAQKNIRGGHYTTGWWSMNYHTVYGRVTGASPSGRLDGEPFTPGLTPHPEASNNLLDNLNDVAALDPETIDNNIAFNVRIVPSAKDSYDQTIDRMTDYVQTFMNKNGMQLQFNVVNTDTLKHAMAYPELYPDLLVRISGYCGYFTKLHRDLQFEIIRRCEYGL